MGQNKNVAPWLAHINSIIAKKNGGDYQAHDSQGTLVTVEWHITPMMTPEYVALAAAVSDLAIESFTKIEMQFFCTFPEAVYTEPAFFEVLEPLLDGGIQAVDWQEVERAIRDQIRRYYFFDFPITDELIKFYSDRFVCFVMVKNSCTNELLGYITYMILPDCSYGMVRLTGIAVRPELQRRGIGKLLMHAIFKIIPEVNRIYLNTRVTNTAALAAYSAWGFVRIDPAPGCEYMYDPRYWIFMRYDVGE